MLDDVAMTESPGKKTRLDENAWHDLIPTNRAIETTMNLIPSAWL
jgi:hypothetical protein